jgi:hypothetical protein
LPYHQFDKLFSPTEATALIPVLELLIRDMQAHANNLREQMSELMKAGQEIQPGELPKVIEEHPELREPATRMAELANKIESHGCFLKDIELGLIDFPCEIEDNHVVFLCWQFGEPAIVAWHSIDSGFAQRQPIPGASKTYLN